MVELRNSALGGVACGLPPGVAHPNRPRMSRDESTTPAARSGENTTGAAGDAGGKSGVTGWTTQPPADHSYGSDARL